MNDTVWKYTLKPSNNGLNEFRMPKGAVQISTGEQGFDLVLWTIVDQNQPRESRFFVVAPTGTRILVNDKVPVIVGFCGTVQCQSGENRGLVFHVLEVVPYD